MAMKPEKQSSISKCKDIDVAAEVTMAAKMLARMFVTGWLQLDQKTLQIISNTLANL